MCFKKIRTEMIEYVDGVEADQETLEKWFPMDYSNHRYRKPHLIMITYEAGGKRRTILVHIRGSYQAEVTSKNKEGYRAGFFPGESDPIQVIGPKLPRINHISSYVEGPDHMMIWETIWERRDHNEITESESDQRERGDRPGSGEPSVQEEQEKGQDEPTEERSPGSVEATDPDHIIDRLRKRIAELEAEKDGQENAAIYWYGNYNNLEEAKDKRIAELKEAGRELLIEAMNLYDAANYNPNRQSARQIFEDEIKLFGLSEGGADE